VGCVCDMQKENNLHVVAALVLLFLSATVPAVCVCVCVCVCIAICAEGTLHELLHVPLAVRCLGLSLCYYLRF
jgi:hypothetical protein